MKHFFSLSMLLGLLATGFSAVQAQNVELPAKAFRIMKNGNHLLATAPSGHNIAIINLDDASFRGKIVAFTYSSKKKRTVTDPEKAIVNVRVFPNPASGEVNFELGGAWTFPVQLKVYDKTGSTVETTQLDNKESSLNVSSFQQGIYILKFGDRNASAVQKLVVR